MPNIYTSMDQLIGRTPLLELKGIGYRLQTEDQPSPRSDGT